MYYHTLSIKKVNGLIDKHITLNSSGQMCTTYTHHYNCQGMLWAALSTHPLSCPSVPRTLIFPKLELFPLNTSYPARLLALEQSIPLTVSMNGLLLLLRNLG